MALRDPKRIQPMLEALKRIWTENPDLRLGQIIVNASKDAPYFVEDHVMMEGLHTLEEMQSTKDVKYVERMVKGRK